MDMSEIIKFVQQFSDSKTENPRFHEYGSAHYKKNQERPVWNPPGMRCSNSSETGLSGD